MAIEITVKIVRVDYDLIKKIGGSFRGQETATQDTIKKLKGVIEKLRGGDWIGLGSTAFLNEMDGEVMPAMDRLQKAMSEGERVSKEIERIQHEAENAIGAFFASILDQFATS